MEFSEVDFCMFKLRNGEYFELLFQIFCSGVSLYHSVVCSYGGQRGQVEYRPKISLWSTHLPV